MFGAMCQFSRELLGGANVPEQMARRDMRLNHFTPLDRGGIRPFRNFRRCRQREPNSGFCSRTRAHNKQFTGQDPVTHSANVRVKKGTEADYA